MRRIIVLGATGFFGGALVDELTRTGLAPLKAARRGNVDLHPFREALRQRPESMRKTMPAWKMP